MRGRPFWSVLPGFTLVGLFSTFLPAESLPLLDPQAFDRSAAAHLLSRTGFGPTPAEIDRFAALGLEKSVEALLDLSGPDTLPAFEPLVKERPSRRELAAMKPEERKKAVRDAQQKDAHQFQALRAWWIRRMVQSSRPLEEKMTLFWHGHFTSSQRDVKNSYHLYLQHRLLRSRALGNFRELTREVAKDPAMLEYLDNNRNVRRAPNENFARELLELFTLGIGNYTEKDVKEAARALTGWTFRGNEFVFLNATHDTGEKTFLGRTGRLGGDDVINVIFEKPAASRHIVRKLWAFFASDDPPPQVVEALSATLRESRFETRPVLAQLFKSAEFYSARSRANQIKSPVQLVVGTLRLLKVDPGESPAFAVLAGRMGQDLFLPPSVKGWDGGRSWISTSSLFDRYNFARPILGLDEARAPARPAEKQAARRESGGRIPRWDAAGGAREVLGEDPGMLTGEQVVDRIARRFLVVPLSPEGRKKLEEFYARAEAGVRLAGLIHLVTSSPEYQLD